MTAATRVHQLGGSKPSQIVTLAAGVQSVGLGRGRRGRPTISDIQLCDLAFGLFVENGFERTSIDAISSAARIAKRTIYARFKDKESLFAAVLMQAIDQWIVPTEQLHAAECEDLEETLRRVGLILVTNVLSPFGLQLMRLVTAESVRFPEITAIGIKRGTEPTHLHLRELFHRRLDHGRARLMSPGGASMAFLNIVVGGVANSVVRGITFDQQMIERHIRHGVHLFLYGLYLSEQELGDGFATPPPGDGTAGWSETDDMRILQLENRSLRNQLIASMLEAAALKDQLAKTQLQIRH